MKTVDEILREMRNIAVRCDLDDDYDLNDAAEDVREIAGKLEKVVAENATTTPTCKESLQVGNAAAMRNALEEFVKYSELVQRMGIFVRDSLVKITTKAREALDKPPRNLELYANPKEAGEAFISESCENPCGNCTVSDECHNPLIHECGINWLFAEAKGEQK